MRMSFAFSSAGSAGHAALVPAPAAQRKQRANVSRLRECTLDDVGLEALGQVLAEPRGFDRSSTAGAIDSSGEVSARADSRVCAGLPAARSVARPRVRGTIAGAFEAAIVIALLAAGSTVIGYPIARAVADSTLVHAMAGPANAHVTETVTAGGAHAVVETTIRRVEPDART